VVRRAQHVEVQVGDDVLELLVAERVDVVLGAEQADSSAPRNANRTFWRFRMPSPAISSAISRMVVVAGLDGVVGLLLEGAGAALDERDRGLVGGGRGEVGVLAARGRARLGVGGITMSLVGTTTPVTSPLPEKSSVPVS
jgi:hypothetical protein